MATRQTVSFPQPSASFIIVNARNEILLVHRNPQARTFGGVHVSVHGFVSHLTYAELSPGFSWGNADVGQDSNPEMTAIRETFEESGLLIGSSDGSSSWPEDSVLAEARKSIHSQRTSFQAFLHEHRLKANISSLLPFTTWVTPTSAPR